MVEIKWLGLDLEVYFGWWLILWCDPWTWNAWSDVREVTWWNGRGVEASWNPFAGTMRVTMTCRTPGSPHLKPKIISRILTVDTSVSRTMKNAAKRDMYCELQNSVNHQIFERSLQALVMPLLVPHWHARFTSWLFMSVGSCHIAERVACAVELWLCSPVVDRVLWATVDPNGLILELGGLLGWWLRLWD